MRAGTKTIIKGATSGKSEKKRGIARLISGVRMRYAVSEYRSRDLEFVFSLHSLSFHMLQTYFKPAPVRAASTTSRIAAALALAVAGLRQKEA
jgi:hypothetical protein